MASGLHGLSLFASEGVPSCVREGGVRIGWALFALAHEEGEDSLVVIAGEDYACCTSSTVLRF